VQDFTEHTWTHMDTHEHTWTHTHTHTHTHGVLYIQKNNPMTGLFHLPTLMHNSFIR